MSYKEKGFVVSILEVLDQDLLALLSGDGSKAMHHGRIFDYLHHDPGSKEKGIVVRVPQPPLTGMFSVT